MVALGALDYPGPEGDGAEVVQVDEQAPAGSVLEEGDVIVEVNGEPVATTCDASLRIGGIEPGDQVELVVLRDGEPRELHDEDGTEPRRPQQGIRGRRDDKAGTRVRPRGGNQV